MSRNHRAILCALNVVGCSPASTTPAADGSSSSSIPPASTGGSALDSTGSAEGTAGSSSAADASDGPAPKYDVHGVDERGPCHGQPAGIMCDERQAIECDGSDNVVTSESCIPGICIADTGCVACTEGQFRCSGPRVMRCDTSVEPVRWQEIDVCDPTVGEGCDGGTGTCEVLEPLGGVEPTGIYYQYAFFNTEDLSESPFADVDCFGNRCYVSAGFDTDTVVHVYQISIEDSDGDGQVEPNQHPDNPDETGPIELRTLVELESVPATVYPSGAEIYALEDRVYVAGPNITEYMFSGASSVIVTPPPWSASPEVPAGWLSYTGYDDVNGVWYAAVGFERQVLQYDADTNQWGIAFLFPHLGGDHFDGMEVVTDPNTGIPYVYVSDMTSDLLAQYRLDPDEGWVQQNVFAYDGTSQVKVEGLGFGPFHHFWGSGGAELYEIGGGDLQYYTEPVPAG